MWKKLFSIKEKHKNKNKKSIATWEDDWAKLQGEGLKLIKKKRPWIWMNVRAVI